MEVYMDNAATTRAYPEVVQLMNKIMEEDYGPQSASTSTALPSDA